MMNYIINGIYTLRYSLNGTFSYNLVPFVGSSIVPICGFTSLAIELLQLFGGRYAELEECMQGNWRMEDENDQP